MRRRLESGFTLIELGVTMLVAAVLVGLAIPSFRDLIIKSRLRGATDDVVNLLNQARASAVKLQRDVNVSANTSNWCVGARAADSPTSIGDPVPAATACDCTASPVTCLMGTDKAVVSGSSYSGVTISNDSANAINKANGGVTFNSKYGALSLGALPTNPIFDVSVDNGRYSTRIAVSQLGQTYVCRPSSSRFVSGYPSC